MKILLIQALDRREKKVYPLGLCYVAASLKHHEVSVFDPNVLEKPFERLAEELDRVKPELVGISFRNLDLKAKPVLDRGRQVLELVRKKTASDTRIVAGGPSFSLYPTEIMKYNLEIDYGVSYEGEEALTELLENLESPEKVLGIFFRKDGKIEFSGERKRIDFDSLPIPERDILDIDHYVDKPYVIGIQTKRGCNRMCVYCSYPLVDGTSMRLRSPAKVVDEIEYFVHRLGINSFTFVDNVFNNPTQHAKSICREMIARKIHITWSAWFDDLDEELVRLAMEAGCREVEYSPDGFSDKTLKILKKKINKKDILASCDFFNKVDGIRVHYHFFFWPPGQDLLSLIELLWFRMKVKWMLKDKLANFRIGPLIIIRNTNLEKIAIEEGLIAPGTNLLFNNQVYWNPRWTKHLFRVMKKVLFLS